MANNALKLSTWLEKILKFTLLKWLKMLLKLSTEVGEIFEIYSYEMAKKTLKFPPWLKFTHLKWL